MLRHSTTTCATLRVIGLVSQEYSGYAAFQMMTETQEQTVYAQDVPLMPHAHKHPHAIFSVPTLVSSGRTSTHAFLERFNSLAIFV